MTNTVPIYNVDHDLIGVGYIVEGEEDLGIRVKHMFSYEKIQSLKDQVALFMQLTATTKEEAIMRFVRKMS